MAYLQNLMNHYGYLILSAGLMLELLALPLPGEFLMTYAGLLIFQGRLNWYLSILAAGAGSSLGMTAAYWIGYAAGKPFFEKVGPRIHLGPDKLAKVSAWFDRYGNKLLLIAYYIPGVRHFTGYFSGVTRLPFRTFAAYAYTGAFVWAGVFITLGKILGPEWERYHHTISKYMLLIGVIAALVVLIVYLVRKKKPGWKERTAAWIERGYEKFRSSGRVGIFIASVFVVFIAAVSWTVAMVQDLLAQEFSEFDELAPLIVHAVFDPSWMPVMEVFMVASAPFVLMPLVALGVVALAGRPTDRLFDIAFYLFSLGGGVAWEYGLRLVFHRPGPGVPDYTFPCEPVILTTIFFGLTAYFAGRTLRHWGLQSAAALAAAVVIVMNGIAAVYLGQYYPSDVAAAYAFGGVWISCMIILHAIYRLLRDMKETNRSAS